MSTLYRIAAASILGLSTTSLWAEQVPELIVTASRTLQSSDAALAAVTVIDRDEIAAAQAEDLITLLDGRAGISISNSGGLGKASSIYLRGSENDHLLVLVDGVRVGSATSGGGAIQNLPLEQIERIEIVRGPRSALYGADAIGGVLQIFTRRGSPAGRYNLSAEVGSEASRRLSAGVHGEHYGLQLSGHQSDGFNARTGNNPDNDGYRNNNLSAYYNRALGDHAELGLSLLHAEGNNEYDGWSATSDYQDDFTQQTLGATLDLSHSSRWSSRVQLAQHRDLSQNWLDGADDGRFETRRQQASWQNDIDLGADLLVLGLDHTGEKISSSTASYDVESRNNNALFAEWQGNAGMHIIQAGLRQDRSDSYGNNTTGNLEVGRPMGNGWLATFAYGTAFRAPTFNDLYWGGLGNPDLQPEESQSLELGLRGDGWAARLFRNEIDNLIEWAQVQPGIWQPQNVARARIDGLELEWQGELLGWSNRVDLTWLNPRNRDSDKLLPRRPQQSGRLELSRALGKLQTAFGVTARGHSYDDADNTTRLPGYALLDLRLGYALNKAMRLQLKGDNLLDQEHRTADGYNSSARRWFLNFSYSR